MKTELGTPIDNNRSPVTEEMGEDFVPRQVEDGTPDIEDATPSDGDAVDDAVDVPFDLEAELDAHEAELSKLPEFEIPDFSAPEFAELSDQFETATGIKLAEAAETFAAMQQQLAELQQAQQQNESESAAKTLMTTWGVQDAEFNRRVELVLAYVGKMSPERQAMYDSVDGIDLVWKRISKGKDKAAPGIKPAKSASASAETSKSGKTFKKSELRELMLKSPKQYQAMEQQIDRAYQLGNIIDDL
jgi:hypothetical protein